jgi:dihydroxyacetone kinase-like protein
MAFGAMQESCGSTSTLIGAFFLGMSDVVEGEEIDSDQMKAMFAAGLANVQKQTKAKVGDKTMMDSLVPAVEEIQKTDGSISDILSKAAESAQKGADSTENLKANFGRARNLGERSVGSIDPGAASWACMFKSFAQVYN